MAPSKTNTHSPVVSQMGSTNADGWLLRISITVATFRLSACRAITSL